jgi:putative PIN family toxin of toxin-antitoxin system
MKLDVVIDTNIIVSALYAKNGAASTILRLVGTGVFDVHISVPLILEYEDVLKRGKFERWWTLQDADDVIDYLCHVATHHKIWYLWRPYLPDAKDDFVLELAMKSQSQYIITYNTKDFRSATTLGILPVTPEEFLTQLENRHE